MSAADPPRSAGEWRLIELETVDSTNLEAHRLALMGERGPVWIRAETQTSGRGRLGRSWISPPGNLAATLLLAPGCELAAVHQLSLVTGVAVHDAVAALADAAAGEPMPRLKWPNDILIGGAKAGGILVESTRLGGDLVAIVGVGINLQHAPEVAGARVARIDYARRPTPRNLLYAIAGCMEQWLARWQAGAGFQAIRSAWLDRAGACGEAISVTADGVRVSGRFAGLDQDGALLMTDATGSLRRYTFGDVALGTEGTGKG